SAALLMLAIYGAILVVWLPLYFLSLLLTTPGVYLGVGGGIYALGRYVARSLTFPGTLPHVMRGLEQEYALQTTRKLEHCVGRIREWASDLRLLLSASSSSLLLPLPSRLPRTHLEVSFLHKHLLLVLRAALQSLIDDDHLTPDRLRHELKLSQSASRLAYEFKRVLESVVWAMEVALPYADQQVAGARVDPHSPTLLAHTDKALEVLVDSLEELRRLLPSLSRLPSSSSSSAPPSSSSTTAAATGGGREGGREGGLWAFVQAWVRAKHSRWDSILGSQLMRQELIHRWNARQIWIPLSPSPFTSFFPSSILPSFLSSPPPSLDCLFIPAQRLHPSTGKSLGLIIYCPPNAGLYEAAAVGGGSEGWVEFYTSLGNDVLLFNYRGYGRSGGQPSPHALTRDVHAVLQFVREALPSILQDQEEEEEEGAGEGKGKKRAVKRIRKVGLHGESIGGMAAAAAAAASSHGVELLVVDRTFSSLAAAADSMLFQGAGKALCFFTGWGG
ncbi:hypothetical protein VYU27_010184, partial [Nannochloropsis oceanica]